MIKKILNSQGRRNFHKAATWYPSILFLSLRMTVKVSSAITPGLVVEDEAGGGVDKLVVDEDVESFLPNIGDADGVTMGLKISENPSGTSSTMSLTDGIGMEWSLNDRSRTSITFRNRIPSRRALSSCCFTSSILLTKDGITIYADERGQSYECNSYSLTSLFLPQFFVYFRFVFYRFCSHPEP